MEESAAGWPEDVACDLERYLPRDEAVMVLYDATQLQALWGGVFLADRDRNVITVTAQRSRPGKRGRREKERLTRVWVSDLGEVSHALAGWDDVREALGDSASTVQGQVVSKYLHVLLLRYTRHGAPGVLALTVEPGSSGVTVKAVESADTSEATRWLRAGEARTQLTTTSVCLVGCGAVGSFVADLLFRSGVRRLHLVDPERMRPGNVVRHRAGSWSIGRPKVTAVVGCLGSIGDVDDVTVDRRRVDTLVAAIDLVRRNDVVVDATGSGLASSLLTAAARQVADDADLDNDEDLAQATSDARPRPCVVSVCLQREGAVVRVDRFPARPGERYLHPQAEPPYLQVGYVTGRSDVTDS